MSISSSSLVDNLSEIYSKRCRDKNCKFKCDFVGLENNKLYYECNKCKKRQLKPTYGLIKKFSNTYKICNEDINKFILLLRKGVYPNEYMDSWEKAFYSELNLEDITDKDYTHAQKVFEEFKLKSFGDYYNLYIQSDTLLLADVSENFRNKCIEIYELDPAQFLSAPGLA